MVKEPFSENVETLQCRFICSSNINGDLDQINQLVSELHINPGNNWRKYIAFTINPVHIYENKTENYYLCKNENFDDIFEKLNTFGLDVNIDNIINLNIGVKWAHSNPYFDYNSSFTNVNREIPMDPTKLLKTFQREYKQITGISHYTILLDIIATDIEINYDKIVQLLQLISKYTMLTVL